MLLVSNEALVAGLAVDLSVAVARSDAHVASVALILQTAGTLVGAGRGPAPVVHVLIGASYPPTIRLRVTEILGTCLEKNTELTPIEMEYSLHIQNYQPYL